jgi:hypothetical protein
MPLTTTIAGSRNVSETGYRTTKDLTPAQRLLLNIMSYHQFGRIENVRINGGQPVLDGGVKVVRAARLGGQSGATKVPSADEFDLKQAVRNLFDELVRLGEGVISRLEFRHGLPFLLETVAGAVPEDPTNAPASLEGRK